MSQIRISDLAHGGDGVGRIDGKVVFVPGVDVGELVEVTIVDDRTDFARGRVVELLERSPYRTHPPCPHFAACGGCQWQFIPRERQAEAKRHTLIGQLAHLGGLDDPPVEPALTPGEDFAYRNRMDFTVDGGRPALRKWRARETVPLDLCLLLVPELAELFDRLGHLGDATSITLRHGTATGETLVLITGSVPEAAESWGVPVARPSGRSVTGNRNWVTEQVAGESFRVTGGGFFQNNTAGAEAIVALLGGMLDVTRDDRLLDGFSGVGLFACTIGAQAASVLCIESAEHALADLERNLEEAAVPAPEIIVAPFESVADEEWSVAVVDPPRAGLRVDGVTAVTAPQPRAIGYVSCDPASLARDTRYLAEAGYHLETVVPVDLFPQTYHIEAVALYRPA